MESLYLFLPLLLGVTVVAQGALNQKVAKVWGLSWAVFLTGILFFIISIGLLLATRFFPQFLPDYLKVDQLAIEKAKWWFAVPGICGFFIVVGVPWSLQTNGASKTFILLIMSQIVTSLVLDKFIFGTSPSNIKIAGAALAMLGAGLVVMSPN